MSHVIDFNLDGSVEAMYSDAFPLGFLGLQTIERASEIKFSEATQKWGLCLPLDHAKGFYAVRGAEDFNTYEGARRVEVAWLNSARLKGVRPDSETGLGILRQLRRELGL